MLSPFISIDNSNSFPKLVRLSDEYSVPYKQPEKTYSINQKNWLMKGNDLQQEENYDIPLEKCDINNNSANIDHYLNH